MQGFIYLHRKMLDNPIICKDTEHIAVWIYLLLNATHTGYDTIFEGKRTTLQPGQLLTGRKSIAAQLNINESKVQRILKTFEIEQQIEQQTTSRNRLITILNWSTYQYNEQQTEQQLNNKRTTTEQQLNTNNNVNKVNNVNNVNNVNKKDIVKHKYGEYKNVLLSDEEMDKLKKEFPNDWEKRIESISGYCASKGKGYKNYLATIRNWAKKEVSNGNLGANDSEDTWNIEHLITRG